MSPSAAPAPTASSKEARASFDWADPLLLEDELTEEERLIRDSARGYCQDRLLPRVQKAFRDESFRPCALHRNGRAGLPRLDDRRLWLRRHQLRQLWADRARGRAGPIVAIAR